MNRFKKRANDPGIVQRANDALPDTTPYFFQKVHFWLLILWIFPGVPVSYFLRNSIAWLVFLSVYAIVTGHWSSWQSSRTEVKQEQMMEQQIED